MPPKKVAATKYLIRARGEGRWSLQDSTPGAVELTGSPLRVFVDTDLAKVVIHAGPNYLEDWNPTPLGAYSIRYFRGGSHVRVAFELGAPLNWRGEIELSMDGLAGRFEVLGGDGRPGRISGSAVVEEERDHAFAMPRPTAALAEKLKGEAPRKLLWEPPAVCAEGGLVLLAGLAGPSRSGKSSLAAAVAEQLRGRGREVFIVEQRRFERSVGSYACSAEVNEAMYDHPCAVDWPSLARALSKAIDAAAASGRPEAPALVVLEGSLALWMPSLCQAMHRRLFLRASRQEVLRRRQSGGDAMAEPFVEHVFWPMHLQFGQPQLAPWEELRVADEEEGFPVPEALLSEALGALDLGATSPPASGVAEAGEPDPREGTSQAAVASE